MKHQEYKSDITKFLEQLHQERPHLQQEQQKGRALLWDKFQDMNTRSLWEGFKKAAVPFHSSTSTKE